MNAEHVDQALFDVAIVGAGIAGLVSALAFGRQGLSVLLLDATKPENTAAQENTTRIQLDEYPPRVSAITPANAQFLASIGLWSIIPASQNMAYDKMYVWEQLGGGNIHFNASDYQKDALGYIVENSAIERAAAAQLASIENVIWQTGSKLDACKYDEEQELAVLCANGDTYQAKLVVAADGANSAVRRAMGFQTLEWDYEQQAIVCTVQTERHHSATALQRFSEKGPVALLPLADSHTQNGTLSGRFSSLVWSIDNDAVDEILGLDDEQFCQALSDEMESRVGTIISASRRFSFPLRQRQAKQYVKQNVVLVADAAHTIHPLAGQGLNLGLADVATLSALIEQYQDSDAPINHPVILQKYQRQRRGENMAMAAAMEGFKRLFGSTDPLLRLLRNTGVNLVNRHTLIKRQIAQQAMGLK